MRGSQRGGVCFITGQQTMSHSILDLMFSGLNETKSVGSLDLMEKRGKAEQKSADGTVNRNRPHSRKMAPLNQVLFRLSLSGAQQYSHPEEGR